MAKKIVIALCFTFRGGSKDHPKEEYHWSEFEDANDMMSIALSENPVADLYAFLKDDLQWMEENDLGQEREIASRKTEITFLDIILGDNCPFKDLSVDTWIEEISNP